VLRGFLLPLGDFVQHAPEAVVVEAGETFQVRDEFLVREFERFADRSVHLLRGGDQVRVAPLVPDMRQSIVMQILPELRLLVRVKSLEQPVEISIDELDGVAQFFGSAGGRLEHDHMGIIGR